MIARRPSMTDAAPEGACVPRIDVGGNERSVDLQVQRDRSGSRLSIGLSTSDPMSML
jgi:hypothetical protein